MTTLAVTLRLIGTSRIDAGGKFPERFPTSLSLELRREARTKVVSVWVTRGALTKSKVKAPTDGFNEWRLGLLPTEVGPKKYNWSAAILPYLDTVDASFARHGHEDEMFVLLQGSGVTKAAPKDEAK